MLYISTTSTLASSSVAYAIPLGTMTDEPDASTGQLRFPFNIPSGSPVYVQVVSGGGAPTGTTVVVQFQFLSTPLN
ncbi:MAG: hypothetical protein ABSA11_11080 [Candidatus Bathyarchaeia archaeon]